MPSPRTYVSCGLRTWSDPDMPVREMLALIPVFDAILTEGSISRAAERLGVTQSAVSQSLARLRKLAGDELFETTGRGVRPTPRALDMAKHLQTALAQVNEALVPKEIEIATLRLCHFHRHRGSQCDRRNIPRRNFARHDQDRAGLPAQGQCAAGP